MGLLMLNGVTKIFDILIALLWLGNSFGMSFIIAGLIETRNKKIN